jgi:hypothetical protein
MTEQLLEPCKSEQVSERFLLIMLPLFCFLLFVLSTITVLGLLMIRKQCVLMADFRDRHENYYPEEISKYRRLLEIELRNKGKGGYLSYNLWPEDYSKVDLSIERDWDYRGYLMELDARSTWMLSHPSTRSFNQFVEHQTFMQRQGYYDVD